MDGALRRAVTRAGTAPGISGVFDAPNGAAERAVHLIFMSPPHLPLLEVRGLTVSFARADGGPAAPAVRGVSFTVGPGETLAVVGESGSGKSVTALALTRLLPAPPARYDGGGQVLLDGYGDLLRLPERDLRRVRGAAVGYVFQDPATSLNPVFTVRHQLGEALALHRPDVPRAGRDAAIVRALADVGLTEPARRLGAYPHELSGGMAQRVMIAMALLARPRLLVADEPTTALDVTVQRQIMDLLRDLQRRRGMSVLLITHNFGILRGVADRVAVMLRGRLVEEGATDAILRAPRHPYTRALIGCVPRLGQHRERLTTIDHAALDAEGVSPQAFKAQARSE